VTGQCAAHTDPFAEIRVYEGRRRSSVDHSDYSMDGPDTDSDREMSLVVTRVAVRAQDVLMYLRERLEPQACNDNALRWLRDTQTTASTFPRSPFSSSSTELLFLIQEVRDMVYCSSSRRCLSARRS
jgi:hypothetical protein